MLHYYRTTIEDLGVLGMASLDVEIKCDMHPAEPQTREYPGCPAEVELESVECITFHGLTGAVPVESRPSWKPHIDAIAYRICEANWDRLQEEIIQDVNGLREAAEELAWEAKREGKLEQRGVA